MRSLSSLTAEKLEELVQDDYSSIKVVIKEFTIPLPPSSLDRVPTEILKIIKQDWTYKYSVDLEGILLYHDQLKFLSDYGQIKDDHPFVYWDVSARFYTFCPKERAIIRGAINKFATKSQVMNALVLNCIIAAFTPEKIHESVSHQMEIGKDILFRIESFDSDHSLIYGTIDEECVELMKQQGLVEIETAIETRSETRMETGLEMSMDEGIVETY